MRDRIVVSDRVQAYINDPVRLLGVKKARKDTADRIRLCRRLEWAGYRPAVRAIRHPWCPR